MQIIGHRGQMLAGADVENTVASVVAALAAGADGVEVDVRLTADDVAVCVHDSDLQRVARISASVGLLSYAELSRVALRSGFPLTPLRDVAEVVRGAGSLITEIKHDRSTDCPTRLVSTVLQTISKAGLGVDEVVVSSFSAAVLADVSRKAPTVRRALVTESHIPAAAGLNEALAWEHHELHAHVTAVLAHPQMAEEARKHGCTVTCWDVNRSCDVRLLDAAGVSGVITDDPAAMRASLRSHATVPTLAGSPA